MRGAPRSPLEFIAIVFLLLLAVGLTPGCGSSDPPPLTEPPEPELSAEEIKRIQAEAYLKALRQKFANLKRNVQNGPERYEQNLENLEGFAYTVEGTVLEPEVKQLIVKQTAVRDRFAMEEFESLAARADKFVADGNFADAEITLSEFDTEKFGKTPALGVWENKFEEVQRLGEAENDFNLLTRRARSYSRQEEYAKAIGLLETFSDDYKTTHYYPEVQTLIEDYLAIYKERKKEESATLAIEWVDLPVDTYLSSFRTFSDRDTEVWTADDEGVISAENSSEQIAQLEVGEDSWASYIIEFEAKVPSGQEFRVGVTAGIRPGQNIKNYDGHSLDLETDDWVKVRVELQDGLVSITDIENFENLDQPSAPYFPMGGMAIVLLPGEEVELRNFRYKVFKGGESSEEGDEESSDEESKEESSGEEG